MKRIYWTKRGIGIRVGSAKKARRYNFIAQCIVLASLIGLVVGLIALFW